jgi:FlaG/FlaF family flagellin (archaellin)
MKARKGVLTLALCLLAGAVCFASDVQMGTWKLNDAKSKIAAGTLKNNTVVYEAAGDSVKVTIEGTAPDGTATHSEWTGKFDGKDYPSTGNPNEDTRSVKQIDDRTLHVTSKKGGKVVLTAHVVVAADGKSRTVTVDGTDAQGKKYKSTAVYDKQ